MNTRGILTAKHQVLKMLSYHGGGVPTVARVGGGVPTLAGGGVTTWAGRHLTWPGEGYLP